MLAARQELLIEQERLENLKNELSIQKAQLMLPVEVEIKAAKQLNAEKQKAADIEIDTAQKAAKIKIAEAIQEALNHIPEYAAVLIKEKELATKEKEQALVDRPRQHRIKANEDYMRTFLAIERENARFSSNYLTKKPQLPYPMD